MFPIKRGFRNKLSSSSCRLMKAANQLFVQNLLLPVVANVRDQNRMRNMKSSDFRIAEGKEVEKFNSQHQKFLSKRSQKANLHKNVFERFYPKIIQTRELNSARDETCFGLLSVSAAAESSKGTVSYYKLVSSASHINVPFITNHKPHPVQNFSLSANTSFRKRKKISLLEKRTTKKSLFDSFIRESQSFSFGHWASAGRFFGRRNHDKSAVYCFHTCAGADSRRVAEILPEYLQ